MDSVSDLMQRAMACHHRGELEEAAGLYKRVLDSEPEHPDALHLTGVVAHQQGRNGDAVALIDRAIANSPRAPAYHNNLGLALTALGLVLLPPLEPQMEMNTSYLIAEEFILPLSAFGTWSEEQMLDGDDSDMGSIEWLLEGSTSLAGTDAFPDFLEPFGVWTNVEENVPISST